MSSRKNQNRTELLKRDTGSYEIMMQCLQNFEEKLFPIRNHISSQHNVQPKKIWFHLNKPKKWHTKNRVGTSLSENDTELFKQSKWIQNSLKCH